MALLLEQEVAQQIGVSIQTMRKWRRTSIGPAHIKIGRTIRYRQEDVDAFLTREVENSIEGKPSAKAG